MDLSLPLALLPRKGYIADFLTPPPVSPLMSIADELEMIRATSPELVAHDVELLVRNENPPETLQPFLDDPAGSRRAAGRFARDGSGRSRSSPTGRGSSRCSRPTSSTARAA